MSAAPTRAARRRAAESSRNRGPAPAPSRSAHPGSATPCPARRPGRPLDPTLRGRTLVAAREVVAEVGLAQATFSRIARRFGAGVPALRRRWPTVRHLVIDALEDLEGPGPPDPARSPAENLARLMEDAGRGLDPSARPFVRTLLFASADDEVMAGDLERVLLEPLRASLRDELRRGVRSGEVRPDIDVDAVVEVLHGAALGAVLTGRPVVRSALSVVLSAR